MRVLGLGIFVHVIEMFVKSPVTQRYSSFIRESMKKNNLMRRQYDTTGERSGAGSTFLRALRNTDAVIFKSKMHAIFKKSMRALGSNPRPLT